MSIENNKYKNNNRKVEKTLETREYIQCYVVLYCTVPKQRNEKALHNDNDTNNNIIIMKMMLQHNTTQRKTTQNNTTQYTILYYLQNNPQFQRRLRFLLLDIQWQTNKKHASPLVSRCSPADQTLNLCFIHMLFPYYTRTVVTTKAEETNKEKKVFISSGWSFCYQSG